MTKHNFSAIFHETKKKFISTITNEFLIPIAAMLPLMTGCAANKTFSPFREPPTGQTVNYPSDSDYNQYENGIDDTSYPTVESDPNLQKGQKNRWHNLTEKELHNFMQTNPSGRYYIEAKEDGRFSVHPGEAPKEIISPLSDTVLSSDTSTTEPLAPPALESVPPSPTDEEIDLILEPTEEQPSKLPEPEKTPKTFEDAKKTTDGKVVESNTRLTVPVTYSVLRRVTIEPADTENTTGKISQKESAINILDLPEMPLEQRTYIPQPIITAELHGAEAMEYLANLESGNPWAYVTPLKIQKAAKKAPLADYDSTASNVVFAFNEIAIQQKMLNELDGFKSNKNSAGFALYAGKIYPVFIANQPATQGNQPCPIR